MILLLPFETAKDKVEIISKNIPFKNKILEPVNEIEEMYNEKRDQYFSNGYLYRCIEKGEKEGYIVLGVTDVDLYSKNLNFIFGSAQMGGTGCIISTNRLGEEKILEERVVKEAVHEIGHVIGLDHCSKRQCVMHFSNSLDDTDRKTGWFCSDCEIKYEDLIRKNNLDFDI